MPRILPMLASIVILVLCCLPRAAVADQQSYGAESDRFSIEQSSDGSNLDVLSNDDPSYSQIIEVGTSRVGGSIINLADRILYQPRSDFHGLDQFSYTTRKTDGTESTATVSVFVRGFARQWRVMPIGDSITEGEGAYNTFRRPLWHQFNDSGFDIDFVGSMSGNRNGPEPIPDFDTDHEGHWAWRVDQFLPSDQLPVWAQNSQPDIAFIHLGTNDLARGDGIPGTISELNQMVGILRAVNPSMIIFIAELIPSTRIGTTLHAEYNAAILTLVSNLDSVSSPLISVDQADGFNGAVDTYDGSHPNFTGETKMAGKWYQAIAPVINESPEIIQAAPDSTYVVGDSVDVDLSIYVSDPEGQALTYSSTTLPAGIVLDGTTGRLTGSPTAQGATSVTITATDNFGAFVAAVFTVTVNVATSPPPPPSPSANSGGGALSLEMTLILLALVIAAMYRRDRISRSNKTNLVHFERMTYV